MKKIINSLAFIGLVSLTALTTLTGCSDVLETEYKNADNKADITFYVTSSENSVPLKNVKIYLISENPQISEKTDENGVLIRKKFSLGNSYTFHIVADGYATQTTTVTITNASGNADYSIAGNVTQSIMMFKLDGSASGSLFVLQNGTKLPAKDAIVRANIACATCDVNYVETSVQADGTYTFDQLPLNIPVSIVGQSFTLNGTRYASENLGTITASSDDEIFMTALGQYNTPAAQALEALATDIGSVIGTKPVDIEFSQAVDESKIGYNDIRVTHGNTVAVDATWNTNKTKVTLTPSQGVWESGKNFTIFFDLESEDGDFYNGSVDFNTYGALSAFQNLEFATLFAPVDADFSPIVDDRIIVLGSNETITVKWDAIDGVADYQIYFMADDDAALEYLTTTSQTTYSTNINPGDADIDAGNAYIQIWAENGESVVKSNIIKIRE